MVAATRIKMTDLSRQKKHEVQVGEDGISPSHTVGQAIDHFRDRLGIRENGFRFSAFSRGVKLDSKQTLGEVPDTYTDWTVMPEVTAG